MFRGIPILRWLLCCVVVIAWTGVSMASGDGGHSDDLTSQYAGAAQESLFSSS
jgi:hypothetical protein